MEKLFSLKYLVIAILVFILAGGGVATFLGWCTGDSTAPATVTVASFGTEAGCNAIAATMVLPTACATNAAVTTGLTTFAGTVTCTPRGRCPACTKINKATSSGGATCVKTSPTNWDLDCAVTYHVNCDCP